MIIIFTNELIKIPINVHRDYISCFNEYPNLKIINLTINNNDRELLFNDKEIQDLFKQYKKRKYTIGIHISGDKGNIYKTLGKVIENNIKEKIN